MTNESACTWTLAECRRKALHEGATEDVHKLLDMVDRMARMLADWRVDCSCECDCDMCEGTYDLLDYEMDYYGNSAFRKADGVTKR